MTNKTLEEQIEEIRHIELNMNGTKRTNRIIKIKESTVFDLAENLQMALNIIKQLEEINIKQKSYIERLSS